MSRIIVRNVYKNNVELLWRNIKIKKSLDNICHTLELEMPLSEHDKVSRHDMITVRYDNPSIHKDFGYVTTVLVDEVTKSMDSEKSSVLVIGRSPARDIIDSTWTDTYDGLTLLKLTKKIAAEFGITQCFFIPNDTGNDEYDPTKDVPSFSCENESPWMKLLAEADKQGLIITANEAGGLYVWKISGQTWWDDFQLIEGQNIKSIEWKENGAEQYCKYLINPEAPDSPPAETDPTCSKHRKLTLDLPDPDLDDDEKIKRRAKTEMLRRRETRVTVTVPGWGLTDAQIQKIQKENGSVARTEIFWGLNLLIPVTMPTFGYRDIVKLLVAEVEYEASAASMSSTLTLVNKEAYQ
jgi:prophage tail gpP-like protein